MAFALGISAIIMVLLVIGVPFALAFGAGASLGLLLSKLGTSMVTSVSYQSIDSFPLLAIPFFILAGELMGAGKISKNLIVFVSFFIGRVTGSLGAITIVASAFFGAISGSAVATVAAIGGIMIPEMDKAGYPKNYTAALVASAGILGVLIPPSIGLILYGTIVNVSIGELFLASVVPGLLMTAAYAGLNYFLLKTGKVRVEKEVIGAAEEIAVASQSNASTIVRFFRVFWLALPALIMPAILIGGIYGGVVTATEAGAIASFYALFVGLFIYRAIKLKDINVIFQKAGLLTAVIVIIIAFSGVYGRLLNVLGLPQQIAELATSFSNPAYFLAMINVILLIMGMFVEPNSAILVMSPVLFPAVVRLGIDPVHFGIIMGLNISIGLLTPPMAANLLLSSKMVGIPLSDAVGHILKFLFYASIPILIAVTYIPAISIWFK